MTKKDIEAAALEYWEKRSPIQRTVIELLADFAVHQVTKAVEECAVIAESKAADRCIKHQASGRGACGYQIANEIRAQAKDKIGL